MIKRPTHARFNAAILEGRKITTIRAKPWPVGIPIMIYNWSGVAYRSRQIDLAPVVVLKHVPIEITYDLGWMRYKHESINAKPLHVTEGFDSSGSMDDWFRLLVRPGEVITQHLMLFSLWSPKVSSGERENKS